MGKLTGEGDLKLSLTEENFKNYFNSSFTAEEVEVLQTLMSLAGHGRVWQDNSRSVGFDFNLPIGHVNIVSYYQFSCSQCGKWMYAGDARIAFLQLTEGCHKGGQQTAMTGEIGPNMPTSDCIWTS